MENRRRIRDLTYRGDRWIVSLIGEVKADGSWRGHLAFFVDAPPAATRLDDPLLVEALEFDQLVAQVSALSVDELHQRLSRLADGTVGARA
jgi:hypothetical protein